MMRKNIKVLILSALFCLLSSILYAMPGNIYQPKDNNNEPEEPILVDIKDAIYALQTVAGLRTVAAPFIDGDVAGDGLLDLKEVIFILRTLSGIVEIEPTVPTSFVATPGDQSVDISWHIVDGATGYNIFLSETTFFVSLPAECEDISKKLCCESSQDGIMISCKISDLINDQPYTVSISSVYDNNIHKKTESDETTPKEIIPTSPDLIANDLDMEFRRMSGGTFKMGSPDADPNKEADEIEHDVTVGEFWIQTTELTQGQWKALMGKSNPSFFKSGDKFPVENVSWDMVQKYIEELNKLGHGIYRLPTEAEWEYAAEQVILDYVDVSTENDVLSEIAWYIGNSGNETHAVGTRLPTTEELLIDDMHGNVSEWVKDWYGDYPDPEPITGIGRVIRGGSYKDAAKDCRSANRDHRDPNYRTRYLGFRLVFVKDEQNPGNDISVPIRPTNLKAVPGNRSITLSWDVITGYAYDVYMAETESVPSDAVPVNNEDITAVPYEISTNIVNETRYYLTVKAKKNGIESPASDFISAVPLNQNEFIYDNADDIKDFIMDFIEIPSGQNLAGEAVNSFWIQSTEVTQKQWKSIMGTNPSRFKVSDDHPVEDVTYSDVINFIGKLNASTQAKDAKVTFRLPADTEWEYAARAGSTTDLYNGDLTYEGDYDPNLEKIAWYSGNSNSTTHPVKEKFPNAWGLYDMIGNVYEWTSSKHETETYNRILRGGGIFSRAQHCKLSSRFYYGDIPNDYGNAFGFRLVMVK